MKKHDEGMRTFSLAAPHDAHGGPGSAGQSGDTQGLSDEAEASPESVLELVQEGQNFEAGVLMGVESTPDRDVTEVRTKQIRSDDVPAEYLEKE